MTPRLRPLPFALLTVLVLGPACKKDSAETTKPDDDTTNVEADAGDEGDEAEPALPPQDPDPAEIAALYDRYLKGDYEAVAQEAEDLRAGLTADTQVRAHALASAIKALAAVEGVPEDGQAAAEQAIADGERLGDQEVLQLARIAHGTYLVRVHEAAAGQAEIQIAVDTAGPFTALAHLMLAEAHLNQAFGEGDEDMKIKNPAKLDEAAASYQAALDGAATAGSQLLQAHAHEGLAAIAKYKNEKQAICDHAQEAENLYAAGGASDYVREVPSLLAKDGKCKTFEKVE